MGNTRRLRILHACSTINGLHQGAGMNCSSLTFTRSAVSGVRTSRFLPSRTRDSLEGRELRDGNSIRRRDEKGKDARVRVDGRLVVFLRASGGGQQKSQNGSARAGRNRESECPSVLLRWCMHPWPPRRETGTIRRRENRKIYEFIAPIPETLIAMKILQYISAVVVVLIHAVQTPNI